MFLKSYLSLERLSTNLILQKPALKFYLSTNSVDWIFTNPNKQNFILDEDVLNDSNIKGINTASTGLNHIDLNYCSNNNIEVVSHKNEFGTN